ncbi:MAG: nitronate monooxygenase [Acidimicrobiales bacterium]
MGIAISGYPLARAVAKLGQLGVVSGTAIDTVFIRRLQNEGVSEALRSVLERFPVPEIVERVVERFAQLERGARHAYKNTVMPTHRRSVASQDLLVLASFAEVAMAKEGHDGLVGMNLLTKVQLPTAPSLFGAILANVDYVMMGAGIPTHIPGILSRLALGESVSVPLDVVGDTTKSAHSVAFDPSRYLPARALRRPKFLGIVSSHVLATALAKRSDGPVDGFVIERPTAGGHNAPPRGQVRLDAKGNPEYGERDRVDYQVMRDLALPFWIGGGVTSPDHVHEALGLGATGVQVGTLFAYCRESGMDRALRAEILAQVKTNEIEVRTSLRASSTGYPFKVASVAGSLSQNDVYLARERKCDLGYLREAYATNDGTIGYRCAAEPLSTYVRKGGRAEDAEGTACLCNGLMATCGLAQVRPGGRVEPPIVTSGDCINEIRTLLVGRESYSAADVVAHLEGVAVNENVAGGDRAFA